MMLALWCVAIATSCSDDEGSTAKDPLAFSITPETIAFPANGGNSIINIHLDSAKDWTLSNTADWITVERNSGNGISHISMAVAANESTEARQTTIAVTSDGETRQVAITQAGSEPEPVFTYDIEPDPSNMGTLTSVELAAQMGTGWNLGNSLEAIGGETAWGNLATTQSLIDAVKAAGFTTIRIPVSWSVFSNQTDYTINPTWLARVEEVVNYALSNNMYVIMNEHWDGGWQQPTYAQQEYVNNRLAAMWKQIATHFRDYDYHLIFAGTNEIMVTDNYNTPTTEYYTVQNSFNQTFVTAVRATGGRNAYRYLTVQGFNTNINHTVAFAEIPEDVTPNRLLMEVHYYDPYNFTLNENSTITQWGSIATDPALTETWANESYVDAQFQSMKTNFIDQGVGVILGEFGAIVRTDVAGSETYREHYINYVSTSARSHGLVPVYWDNGFIGNHTMALFNRNTGEVLYPGILEAVMP
ncbi:endoglucanase [Flavobacterium akiainvivens]|nr:endoglucanase [Flavobacterium akiainvivens]